MSMRDLEARLRAHPDDEESWLVYADALVDAGDPRGQLIALDHRRRTGLRSAAAARALEAEIDALVAEHRASWAVRALDGLTVDGDSGRPEPVDPEKHLEWRHGFVVGLRLPLSNAGLEGVRALLASPQARLLSSLDLSTDRDLGWTEDDLEEAAPEEAPDPHVQTLAAFDLGAITHLRLGYAGIGVHSLTALLGCPTLTNLVALDLRYNRIGDAGARALAGATTLGALTALHLQRNEIGPDGVSALAGAAHLGQLTTLDLRFNPIGPDGARALAGSPVSCGLRSLHLYRDDVGPDGARALAASRHLPLATRRYWKGP